MRCLRSPAGSFGRQEAYKPKWRGDGDLRAYTSAPATRGALHARPVAWKSGDFAKSEQAFDKALSIDPRHVKSLVNLSRVLHRSETARRRHRPAHRAAEIDPDSAEVQRLLGRPTREGQTDEATRLWRAIDERARWSMNNLGLCSSRQARRRGAAAAGQGVELRKDVPNSTTTSDGARAHGRFKARPRINAR